jgi:hypothetical protein
VSRQAHHIDANRCSIRIFHLSLMQVQIDVRRGGGRRRKKNNLSAADTSVKRAITRALHDSDTHTSQKLLVV